MTLLQLFLLNLADEICFNICWYNYLITAIHGTRRKVLWQSTNRQKRSCRQHLATLATPTCTILRPASFEFLDGVFCKQSPFFVNNRRFTEFFDRCFHIPLPITTKHKLPFPPRNLPIKFGANPSTIVLVTMVTDRQTDTQTNEGENIFPRFCGDNNRRSQHSQKCHDPWRLRFYALWPWPFDQNKWLSRTHGETLQWQVRWS